MELIKTKCKCCGYEYETHPMANACKYSTIAGYGCDKCEGNPSLARAKDQHYLSAAMQNPENIGVFFSERVKLSWWQKLLSSFPLMIGLNASAFLALWFSWIANQFEWQAMAFCLVVLAIDWLDVKQ